MAEPGWSSNQPRVQSARNSFESRNAAGREAFPASSHANVSMRASLCSLLPAIPMMKTSQPAMGDRRGGRRRLAFHRASMWRILREGIVNPVVVVIVQVIMNQPPEMFFIERNDVVQDLPATASNPSLCDSILPRRPNARPLRLQTRGLQETNHIGIDLESRSRIK